MLRIIVHEKPVKLSVEIQDNHASVIFSLHQLDDKDLLEIESKLPPGLFQKFLNLWRDDSTPRNFQKGEGFIVISENP